MNLDELTASKEQHQIVKLPITDKLCDRYCRTVRMLEEIVENQQYDLERMISDTMPMEKAEEAIQKMIRGENLGKILLTY
ncbi:hypothetical protein ACFSVM_11120 [Paenibacillus shunpengii]|uniref:Zinc-binding dehydrogenase n=1 Tax=Paenibacillus shunpengii TaxID=2054424 RepID=A0ABW5SP21_9BACL